MRRDDAFDPDDLEMEEIIRRIDAYRELEKKRLAHPYSEKFAGEGHRLDFKGNLTPNRDRGPGSWFDHTLSLDRDTEKRRGEELARNLRQVELETERQEKAAIRKRLARSQKARNVSQIRPSRVVSSQDNFEIVMSPTVPSPPINPFSEPCFVRLRLLDGETALKVEFQTETTLETVLQYIVTHPGRESDDPAYLRGIALVRPYPRKKYNVSENLSAMTLSSEGLNNGTLLVVPDLSSDGFKLPEGFEVTSIGDFEARRIPKWRLRGESRDEAARYKKKMERRRLVEIRREKAEKKRALERVRLRLAEDRARRFGLSTKPTTATKTRRTSSSTSATAPLSDSDECAIQFKLLDGGTVVHTFQVSESVDAMAAFLFAGGHIEPSSPFTFVIAFPRRVVIRQDEFSNKKIRDLGLGKRGQVLVRMV